MSEILLDAGDTVERKIMNKMLWNKRKRIHKWEGKKHLKKVIWGNISEFEKNCLSVLKEFLN